MCSIFDTIPIFKLTMWMEEGSSMANKNGNTFLKWFAIIFFIMISAGLYWITSRDPLVSLQRQYPNIKVYTDAKIPPGDSSAAPPVDSATGAIADATGSSSSSAAAIGSASATTSGIIERVLLCTINDVLGEAVESGTIQVGAQTIPFKQGQAQLKELPPEPFQITANAEGYLTVMQTVSNRETSTVAFVMDYTCSFDVQVYGPGSGQPPDAGNGLPQAGAEVTLVPFSALPASTAANPTCDDRGIFFCNCFFFRYPI